MERNREIEEVKTKAGKMESIIKDRNLLESEIRKLKSILEDKLSELDTLKD